MAKKSKSMSLRASRGIKAKSRKWVTDLRMPGSSKASSACGGKAARATARAGSARGPSSPHSLGVLALAQLLGGQGDLMGPAPAEQVDGADRRSVESLQGMAGDVRAGELVA